MFYHNNKAKGSSVPSNFTVSWSSSSTSAVRKRDHLAVMHRSWTWLDAEEGSGVLSGRAFRNRSMFQGSPSNWMERCRLEETNRPSSHLIRTTFVPFSQQEIETTAPSWRSPTWLWTTQRFQKVTRYFGFLIPGGPGDTLYLSMICGRQLVIICDIQTPVRCC